MASGCNVLCIEIVYLPCFRRSVPQSLQIDRLFFILQISVTYEKDIQIYYIITPKKRDLEARPDVDLGCAFPKAMPLSHNRLSPDGRLAAASAGWALNQPKNALIRSPRPYLRFPADNTTNLESLAPT